MILDITKKPLIKSITQLGSQVTLFMEVTGSRPSRIDATKAQFDWYVGEISKTALELGLQLKPTKILEPTFTGIPVCVKND